MKKNSNQTHYKTAGFKPKKITVILILAAVIIVAAVSGLMYYRNLNRVVFDESMVYHISGIDYDIAPGGKAIVEKDGSVTIDMGDNFNIMAEELPLYYRQTRGVITVCPMAFYEGPLSSSARAEKLETFTKVEMLAGDVTVSKGTRHNTEQGSFLYDGEDTYVLLDSCELRIGEERTIQLSPLSYVIAVYDSYIMYYDYASDSFEYVKFDFNEEYQSVSVHFQNGSYLDCDLDMIWVGENSAMLPSAINTLPGYF